MIEPLRTVEGNSTVIVANGAFPKTALALRCLDAAKKIICCDGAAEELVRRGYIPAAIVGDLDSLSMDIARKYSDILYPDAGQETNDLTKAVEWCVDKGIKSATILGATGLREDHTVGNISLLVEYLKVIDAIMVTDHSLFFATGSGRFSSFAGQKISLFAPYGDSRVTSSGLEYPLKKLRLDTWWKGTLNVCLKDSFELEVEGTPVIISLLL